MIKVFLNFHHEKKVGDDENALSANFDFRAFDSIESAAKNRLKIRSQIRQNAQGLMRPGGPLAVVNAKSQRRAN